MILPLDGDSDRQLMMDPVAAKKVYLALILVLTVFFVKKVDGRTHPQRS
jgi:hypothetical protein